MLAVNPAQAGRRAAMKIATKTAPPTGPSAERQLEGFIGKFDSKNAELIRPVRKAMRKRLPTANELVYDNDNFFVIGYYPAGRSSDCIVSIAAANGVSLSFYYGAALPGPHKLRLRKWPPKPFPPNRVRGRNGASEGRGMDCRRDRPD